MPPIASWPRRPERSVVRTWHVRFATLVAMVNVVACNSLLGNEERLLDDVVASADAGGASPDDGTVDSGVQAPIDTGVDAGPFDSATSDADVDAGLRMPATACLKTNASVNPNAVRRVEIDKTPAPVSTGTTVTASFTIFGDNALSNVHLDFCTPDGLRADVGGGTNFLGGGGAVTRRWQTKSVATMPVGRVQAQVYSDDPPVLRHLSDLDLY